MVMVYDQPTQSLGVSGAPKPQAFEAPDYKDYGSQQQMEVGKASLNMGSQMMIVAKDMENTIAEAATRERINTLETSVQDMLMNPESGYLTKISKDAVDGSKPTLDALGELDRKLGDGCKTDLERAMYRRSSDRILKATRERIYGHLINQAKAWNTMEATKGLENAAAEEVQNLVKDPFWSGGKEEVPGVMQTGDMEMPAPGGKPITGPRKLPVALQTSTLDPKAQKIVEVAWRDKGLNGIAYAESGSYKDPYVIFGKMTDHGRGIGRYQIMEEFWDEFAARAGYPKGTKPTPEVQDHVAAVNWLRLMDKYKGNARFASIAWNAGEGTADAVIAGDTKGLQYLNDPKNAKSTVLNFSNTVLGEIERSKTQRNPAAENAEGKFDDFMRVSGMERGSESEKAMRRTYSENVLVQTINAKLEDGTDPARIKKFMDAHATNIDQNKLDILRKKLSGREGEVFGQSAWDAGAKTLDVNNGPDMASLYAKVDGSNLNDDGKRLAYAKLADLKNKYEVGKRSGEERASQDIYGMINKGAAFADIMKNIDASTTLDERSKLSLRDLASSKYGVPDPAAAKRQEQDIQHLTNLFQFQQDYAAGRLGKMQPADAAKYASSLGKYTDNAMTFINHANASALDVKLTMDDMKNRIRVMSMNPQYKDWNLPDVDKPSESEKADLALLQSKVLELMAGSAKGGPGKAMSADQALSYALKEVVTGKGWFGIRDKKAPAYKVGSTGYDKPKDWPLETATQFINTNFYTKYGRLPSKDEFNKLFIALKKEQ